MVALVYDSEISKFDISGAPTFNSVVINTSECDWLCIECMSTYFDLMTE